MNLEPLTPNLIDEITSIVFEVPGEDPIQPCDVIFIFGGSHPGLWETAAEVYNKGLGKVILVTGGCKPNVKHHHTWIDGDTPEALVIRRELLRLGVLEATIVYEDNSTNSLENVLFAQEVYDFSRVSRILAVCKNYGAGRQCRTLRKQLGPRVNVIPYPFDTNAGSDGPWITRENWMEDEHTRALVLRELKKIFTYGDKGDLQPVMGLSSTLESWLTGG